MNPNKSCPFVHYGLVAYWTLFDHVDASSDFSSHSLWVWWGVKEQDLQVGVTRHAVGKRQNSIHVHGWSVCWWEDCGTGTCSRCSQLQGRSLFLGLKHVQHSFPESNLGFNYFLLWYDSRPSNGRISTGTSILSKRALKQSHLADSTEMCFGLQAP